MKTEKLTEKQQVELEEYRNEIFQQVVSTRTDKEKAEKYALRLIDGVIESPEIHWVKNPQEAKKLYDSLWGSLSDSLWSSLWGSLWGSLESSLWDSLRDSLESSLWDSLRDSLWGSMWNSLCDSRWIAFYRFPEKIGLVKYPEKYSNMLKCYEKLLQSCFAIYAVPGHVILVENPSQVTIKEGKLINIQFGEE